MYNLSIAIMAVGGFLIGQGLSKLIFRKKRKQALFDLIVGGIIILIGYGVSHV